ncbi:Putative acyl-CoA dehydrogenase YdbM [Variovorax sp. PBL-E5]|nr:Putative acyl-CoA dehydrogenase YdbM [Variovorax sp. PBL-E5]
MTMSAESTTPAPEILARALAEDFWRRAADHDAAGSFPTQNFDDLRTAGLLSLNVPSQWGGAGLGPEAGKPLELWKVTRAIAFGDPATAQSFHVHANEIDIILGLGTPQQHAMFLEPVVDRGVIFGGYGSQLADSTPTIARRRDGGWVLDGKKFFCTNCEAAGAALVWALVEGDEDPSDRIQVFCVSHDNPGLRIQRGWWEQFQGMRSTGSHVVQLDRLELDESAALGKPGDYLRLGLQARAYCQFAASFVGIADRLLHESCKSVAFRKLTDDASAIARIGNSRLHLDAAWGLVERAAQAYQRGEPDAPVRANMARYFAEQAVRVGLENALDNIGTFAGSAASGMPKLARDIHLYIRHESRDRILRTIGAAQLDLRVDTNFSGDNPILKGLSKHEHSPSHR